jgi:hypothetical protein
VSDFDTVLERLVSDPSFAAALAADPGRALAGYRLSADEVALLHSQVGGDTGGQTAVETRATQSSVFGLLSPLAGLGGGLAEAVGFGQPAGTGIGQAAGTGFGQMPAPAEGFGRTADAGVVGPIAGAGSGPAGAGIGHAVGAGWGAGTTGFGEPYAEGFGAGAGAGPSGLGPDSAGLGAGSAGSAAGSAGLGSAEAGSAGLGAGGVSGMGSRAAGGGLAGLGEDIGRDLSQPPEGSSARGVAHVPPPEGYHTRVDVDGDGTWDRHTLHGRADGGVDIHVDLNRDGRVDFIGHDDNADGLVDSAAYDKDHDGFFEKRMYDDDGDGWLDRSQTYQPPR